MAKQLILNATECILQLTGFHRIAALKHEISMDYAMIQSVHIGTFDSPFWMLKMPGTAIPGFSIYEGSFWHAKEWYFLSYESRGEHVIIELHGHDKYTYVIFDIENSEHVVAQLKQRLR